MDIVALIKEPFKISIEDYGVEDELLYGLKLPSSWTAEALIHYIAYIHSRMNWNGVVADDNWMTAEGNTYHTNDEKIQEFLNMTESNMLVSIEIYEVPFILERKDTMDGFIIISQEVQNRVKTEGVIKDVIKNRV